MQITGGYLNSRKIKTNKDINVKPTLSKIRQGIFNILLSLLGDFSEKSFLDLFAGSAIMSFEAVSRGFNPVVTIEKDKKTARFIKENFNELQLKSDLFVVDAINFLKKADKNFDIIFLDPPYESNLYDESLRLILNNNLLKCGGFIVMEHKTDKIINAEGFKIVKIKEYRSVKVSFLKPL